jgi:hypothetical protein
MAEQTFNQIFDGYWREQNKSDIPKSSGVYCVYECTYNKIEKKVKIHKLIYIGESGDVNSRIANHEKLEDWKKHVRQGNELCYNFSHVEEYYRERVEAAFIYHHKPPENTEYVNNFPFDKTIVKSTGKTALLDEFFVANTTK